MPARDGTGPMGQGPVSGRAAGRCAAAPGPASGRTMGGGPGRGWGCGARGGGGGRGWRHGRVGVGWLEWMRGRSTPAPSEPADYAGDRRVLSDRAAALQAELDRINSRLSETRTGRAPEEP